MNAADTVEHLPHREALLEEGLNQFFLNGYNGTTVDGLLEASGVPKGSFYHHFKSKGEFATAVLARYGGFHHRRMAAWATKPDLSTPEVIVGYFEEICGIVLDSDYLVTDLHGKLATEIATTAEPLRIQMADLVTAWRAQLEEILRAGQQRGDVRADREVSELSAAINALIDGALVVVASTRDKASLDSVSRAIRALTAAT